MARPTKYNPDMNEQVYKLCLLGATDKQIADFFNVTEKTINNWKSTEEEFLQSLKKGKIDADAEAAQTLYKRATGNWITTEEKLYDGETITLSKTHLPDTTAAIFWLKNRQPELWRDKQEFDHTTKGRKINSALVGLSFDELYELKYGRKPARQSD